jgi:hypothetical protein
MPYALPPERFTDPQPLPTDYRYPKKEYIRESLCTCESDAGGSELMIVVRRCCSTSERWSGRWFAV